MSVLRVGKRPRARYGRTRVVNGTSEVEGRARRARRVSGPRRLTMVLLVLVVAMLASAPASDPASSGGAAAPGKSRVWFAPLPPMPTHPGRPYVGAPDFMQLFSPKARWSTAAKRVSVFKLYGEWVGGVATDGQLRRVVRDLRRRKIALALETGPLDPTPECGEGVEGFATVASGLQMARRIASAGGVLRYIALDEPYFFGSRYQGPRACRWDAPRVARGVAAFVRAVRRIFPRVVVGDTEPVTSASDAAAYLQWLDVYRSVSGQRLAFIHLDMSYGLPGWESLARAVEVGARSRGVPAGLIVFGEPADTSDRAWTARARARIERYEVEANGRPDHVLFQSWQDRPNRTLPDSSPSTFSGLVRAYARPRTTLAFGVAAPGADVLEATGRLLTEARTPVRGARVEVTAAVPVRDGAPIDVAKVAVTTGATGTFRARLEGVPTVGVQVRARYAGTGGLWPSGSTVVRGEPLDNLARGRPVTAGAWLPESPPSLAVDGDPSTLWIAGAGPPMWLQVDLGAPARIAEVRLRVAQFPAGATAHRVLALIPSGWTTLRDFVGSTTDDQVLTARPAVAVASVTAIRVETSESPSWVAWKEIEAIGSR